MKKSKHVIIIGGGVIGAFTAYYLLEKGWSITIVDRERFGQGASSGNCGLIVPNHILPLNSLETLTKGLKWMLTRDSPLYIKPRWDARLIKWLIQFACHAHPKTIMRSVKGRHALMQSSFELFPGFIHSEKIACDWDVGGSLHIYRSARDWHHYRKTDAFLRQFGIQAHALDKKALLERVPALGNGVNGGWLYTQTAHLRPERLMSELRRILVGRGVQVLENCHVRALREEKGHATAIVAGDTEISADAFVLATGVWAPDFEKTLGCRLPIQPGKGYAITMDRPRAFPHIPCFFEEESMVSTPWPDACRLGGTMEFSGFDTHLDPRRLGALTRGFNGYSDQWQHPVRKEEWCGFRPMTMDGLPFIDAAPRLNNVMIAAGHNMIGLSTAPGTGKLVAELMDASVPHIDPHPYRIARKN
jgi:D-amino-acid dehydrogenase